ncbi:MAG: RluA family pseudouridine synthase [Planctomycetes bacterium]|nr:RluA family pseudouridine synthase [Planctomycetota bacterium]
MEGTFGSARKLRFDLTTAEKSARLDQVLVARVAGWSRTRLSDLVKSGHVRVDGAVVIKPGLILLESRSVEVELAEQTASRPTRFREPVVLFQDEHLLALDKPAGTLTHGNTPGGEASAASWAEERFGPLPQAAFVAYPTQEATDEEDVQVEVVGEAEEEEDDEQESGASVPVESAPAAPRPGVVHRLDRDTSGVLLLARTELALVELQRQFREREVEKLYAALVNGDPRFDSDWIEGWLGRHPKAPDKISVVREGTGRAATTYYEVRERFRGAARLAVFPKTGRTHQVRVHLASIELSIVGEKLYVPKRRQIAKLPPDAPALSRQALHAERLTITHPATGKRIYFEAPWPADMQAVLEWLRVHRTLELPQ